METHKSKIKNFQYLFMKYNLNNDNCIFVTDTLGDILEANEVKLNTIAIDCGFHERERLQKRDPMKIISNYKDLGQAITMVTHESEDKKYVERVILLKDGLIDEGGGKE